MYNELKTFDTEECYNVLLELGMMLKNGIVVRQNKKKALEIFTEFKKNNFQKGTLQLAIMHKYGQGIKENKTYGNKLIKKVFTDVQAMLRRHPDDHVLNYKMGCMLADGDFDMLNMKKAELLLKKVASKNNFESTIKLFEMEKNLVKPVKNPKKSKSSGTQMYILDIA